MSTYLQFGKEPTIILQPDYQLSHNGYGLMQLTANYAIDIGAAGVSTDKFYRGADFYAGSDGLDLALSMYPWTCVKAEEKGRDGNIGYVTAHYAAIKQGIYTETEASITSAAVSEPIETHPNFSTIQVPGIGDGETPLGGVWIGNTPPDPNVSATNKFRAQWAPIQGSPVGALTYNFMAFLPSKSGMPANRKSGVKSWMRPTLTLKATVYTSSESEAASICSYVGFIMNKKAGVLTIPDCYDTIGNSGLRVVPKDVSSFQQGKRDWLIVGANMEVYGGLYKVTADLLLSGVMGWDSDIYPRLSDKGFVQTSK